MKNVLTKPGGHAWQHIFMACSKPEKKAIYLVKKACGNDKWACVYQSYSACQIFEVAMNCKEWQYLEGMTLIQKEWQKSGRNGNNPEGMTVIQNRS